MQIKSLILITLLLAAASISFAQPKKRAVAVAGAGVAPEQVVKNLYAAKEAANPFFQHKSRALVNKYFTGELADAIWKDATRTGEGVGALDFDPLYQAQDVHITNLVIGKADANGVVKVRFKNMKLDVEIIYTVIRENTPPNAWKIESIMYNDAEDLNSILQYGMMTEAEMKAADSQNRLDGDYLVGNVKCNITTAKSGYWARVKCDDQENFQVIDTESMTFGTFNPNEKGRKGKFVFKEGEQDGEFIDASGKKLKVSRVK